MHGCFTSGCMIGLIESQNYFLRDIIVCCDIAMVQYRVPLPIHVTPKLIQDRCRTSPDMSGYLTILFYSSI